MNKTIQQAKAFAIKAHGNQQYGDKPYAVHLNAVAELLKEYGETAQIIAYLHDVIEDTEITYTDVKNEFGEFIADCVAIVTDEPGTTRKERKKKTYAKMKTITGDLELALIVKTADRLANIQSCIDDGLSDLLEMYIKEHPAFQAAVYREDLCVDIWQKIQGLVGKNMTTKSSEGRQVNA